MKKTFITFAKYCGVAGGAALSDWLVFVILDVLGVNHIYAQMISRISGGVFSFVVNRKWSFNAGHVDHLTRQGRRFMLLYAFSYALSVGLLYFLVDVLGMPKYAAKLAADSTCFVVNFVAMRIYVFKDRAGFTAAFASVLTWLDKRIRP